MAPTPSEFRALLESHLAFLASHRGTVETIDGNTVVTSEAPGFSTVFATGRPLTATAIGGRSVRTVPWNDAWASQIPRLGLMENAKMIFMVRDPRSPHLGKPLASRFNVRRAQTAEDMTVFADVQARGFLGPAHPEFAWWRTFMKRKAHENLYNPLQRFLLAFHDSDPVGVLVTVYTDSLIGLYAIATLPEHRRRGVCTTLVRVAEADAVSRAITTATLQVMAGSVAETVYRDLGYREVFSTPIYQPSVPAPE
jgi:ribosomal protein S18 acetylase RimI-like enzyme